VTGLANGDEDVLRLEVTMHHSSAMDVVKAFDDLEHDVLD
jgi:hypothetical protein